MGSDQRLDERATRELNKQISEAEAELAEIEGDPNATELEIRDVARLLDRLRSQKKQDTGLQGKSKLLGSSDKDKARGRVRKAIAAAISFVGQQSPEIAKTLETSIGEGREIYFNPPPDWGI